jgi:hypothetical protein
MRHLCTVLPTKEGIEQFRKHLEAGNQAIIVTYGKCLRLTKRNKGYVSLAENGKAFLIGYGGWKQYKRAIARKRKGHESTFCIDL